MLKYIRFFFCFALLVICTFCRAQSSANKLIVTENITPGAFPFQNNTSPAIYIDTNDAKVVQISAEAFANDVLLVTGNKLQVKTNKVINDEYAIVAGTIGHAVLIDGLIANKKIIVDSIKEGWEQFSITVINQPYAKAKKLLVIAGSDNRGTAFGIFHLSRSMGVSPFVWWADVIPNKKKQLFISGNYTSSPPSVKYRGIFLNDEDWGLQPWAAKTFEAETGDIGPKTYARIFELMLRLKANLIWPAMHESTKAFFQIPGNAEVAKKYSILVGTSHAEPMLRNNVGEWNEKTMGHFNYITNKERVYKYWEDRVKESSGIGAIYTMGMRGVHDSEMEGIKDEKEAVPLLENIIKEQRELLARYLNKDVKTIPQAFTAYKEVLDIYDNGLKLPEDVTLVWPDDNYGYIQRLNNETEKKRAGGSGVYYHVSYWGRPHDYLWVSSTHPALVQEEMMKAYENGSNRIWVLNVGDIKPLEYSTELFLDMAYDATAFKDSSYSRDHMLQWASKLFGNENSQKIQSVLWEYFQLAFERRPEFMGWSQTEPTTETNYTSFNHFYYGDEAQKRIDRYQVLENEINTLRSQMLPKDEAAFYQMIYYQVRVASLINKKFLYRDKSYLYAKQNRLVAHDYAQMAKAVYDSIIIETGYFNEQLSGGKWKNMMSMKPRDLPVFQAPVLPQIKTNGREGWSVLPEGVDALDSSLWMDNASLKLPSFDNQNRQQYFIDLFLLDTREVEWTATTSVPWIKLSNTSGKLSADFGKKQNRIYVTLDWYKAPKIATFNGKVMFEGGGKQLSVSLSCSYHSLNNFKAFTENNGFVSIYAGHYNRKKNQVNSKWVLLPYLGYTGNCLEAEIKEPPGIQKGNDTGWIKQNSAYIEYDFYTFSKHNAAVAIYSLPTHPLNNGCSMRYAVSVDEGPLQVVDFRTFGRSEEWKENVLSNSAKRVIQAREISPGRHSLRIYAIDPGIILDRILIDLGGLKNAYSSIPETAY